MRISKNIRELLCSSKERGNLVFHCLWWPLQSLCVRVSKCTYMCIYASHVRPLTLHWSDRRRLEAPITSPDLSKACIPPPLFIITISNFNFQFLPPSSSQFATKLHPWERRWEDCRTRGCKHIYNVAGERTHTSPLITVMLNVNVCLYNMCVCMCVCACVRTKWRSVLLL